MRTYRIISRLLPVVVCGFLASCYGDKGNDDYSQIPEVGISGIDEEYVITLGSGITIHPRIDLTGRSGESGLTYEWLWMGGKENESYTVISTDRDLVDFNPPLQAGTHKMLYRVTEPSTGVQWTSEYFTFHVENDITRGILLLCDDDGVTRLLHLNYPLGAVVQRKEINLFELPEMGRPIGITTYMDSNSPFLNNTNMATQYAIVMQTETGNYRLRNTDLHYEDDYDLRHMFTSEMPQGWEMKRLIPSRNKQSSVAFIQDGDGNLLEYIMFGSMKMWTAGAYANSDAAGNLHPTTGDVVCRVQPWMFAGVFFMDEATRSFWGRDGMMTSFMQFPAAPPEGGFSYRNTNSDLLYMTYTAFNSIYAILRERTTGEIRFVMFTMMGMGGYTAPFIDQVLYPSSPGAGGAPLPGIERATGYALVFNNSIGKNSLFFYSTPTDVYVYNLYDYTVKSVYTAPAGSTIAMIRMMDFWPLADNLLVVTRDGSKPASECDAVTVFMIRDTYGDLTTAVSGPIGAAEPMHWEGLPRIVSLDWKQL